MRGRAVPPHPEIYRAPPPPPPRGVRKPMDISTEVRSLLYRG